MRNPLQVYKDQLPVWIHHVQDGLELWVHLSLLHYWQVVPQGSQTGLELLMIQLTRLVLVKVPVWTKSCPLLQTFHPQTSNETTSICKYWGNLYNYYLCFIFFHRIEWLFILTWTSWRILWEHPRIHHYGSWPGSVAPDCAASSFLTDPADPTAALAQLCYALCIWNQATNVNV